MRRENREVIKEGKGEEKEGKGEKGRNRKSIYRQINGWKGKFKNILVYQ